MSNYRGDFRLGKTVDFKFTTVDSSGVASALDSTSVIVWYTDNSTTLSTAGLSVAIPFNSTTVGLNHVRAITASTSGFATQKDYEVIILSGACGGKSLAGYVVGGFSIENRGALMPTVADRTLDVSAGGEGGVDWANVGSPTTALNLSGTNIDVDQVVASVSGAVGSVTGAVGSVTGAVGSVTGAVGSVTGNVGGNVTGSVGSVATGGIAAASFAAGAIDAAAIAANAIGASEIADGAIDAATFAAGAITATVIADGAIDAATFAAGAITATVIATGAIDADALAADAVDEIWDEAIGDGAITARQAQRVLVASQGGKVSGAATTTVTIRNVADTADVVVATVDASGNRTATTVTP